MDEREESFVYANMRYTLKARGPAEAIDFALTVIETLIRDCDTPVVGMVDVHDCFVRIECQPDTAA
jgi:hypothetical protein